MTDNERFFLCRDEITELLKSRIDKFKEERRKERKRSLRRAIYQGFLEGFFSIGEGFAVIGCILSGNKSYNDILRERVYANTHNILDDMDRDWQKAYTDFWEEEKRLENEIAVKYGFTDRDDFFKKWSEYSEVIHDT